MALIEAYIFSGQYPIRDEVLKCLGGKPSILQTAEIGKRIILKMKEYVEVLREGWLHSAQMHNHTRRNVKERFYRMEINL